MSEYLNATMKQIVLCVAGCQGFMDVIYQDTPEKLKPVRRYIKTIYTLTEKILECAEEGIDKDQLANLLRWADNCELQVMPRTNAKAGKKYVLVDVNDVERILRNSLSDCGTCLKSAAEVKQCDLKKCLLRCGVLPREGGRGECPFQP